MAEEVVREVVAEVLVLLVEVVEEIKKGVVKEVVEEVGRVEGGRKVLALTTLWHLMILCNSCTAVMSSCVSTAHPVGPQGMGVEIKNLWKVDGKVEFSEG